MNAPVEGYADLSTVDPYELADRQRKVEIMQTNKAIASALWTIGMLTIRRDRGTADERTAG